MSNNSTVFVGAIIMGIVLIQNPGKCKHGCSTLGQHLIMWGLEGFA